MALLVRTWNLFHGRTVPEGRSLPLERMVRLVTEDGPAVVGLQEVPVWALACLEDWSGMRAQAAVAMPALGGPLARSVTALRPRLVRSALVGQANVILLGEGLETAGAQGVVRLNPAELRRSVRADRSERVDWARNRRVAQIVPVGADETRLVVVNLHASKNPRLARAELERLAGLLPGGAAIVCGDFNVQEAGLPGFSEPIGGIDQILVRGLELAGPPLPWRAERRRHAGVLLSDHAPVEASVTVPSRAA